MRYALNHYHTKVAN